jgi:HAD superfamily hydrolase (TIGR01509 family)
MPQLKALLFDVDGTLADTERDGHRIAFNAAFAEAGLDWEWSPSLYEKLLAVTGGKERIRHYLEQYRGDYDPHADLEPLIARLHAAKTTHYTALLARGAIPLRPGVRRLLEEARREGLRLAIATTTTPANVTCLLENTLDASAASWFDVIAAGDVVPAKKPAPDIYEYALERMGLAATECLAFEDSENGIRAARGAGLATIITVNDYTREHDFTGACLVVDHLGEPGQACTALQGDCLGASCVDIGLLRRLHARAVGSSGLSAASA